MLRFALRYVEDIYNVTNTGVCKHSIPRSVLVGVMNDFNLHRFSVESYSCGFSALRISCYFFLRFTEDSESHIPGNSPMEK